MKMKEDRPSFGGWGENERGEEEEEEEEEVDEEEEASWLFWSIPNKCVCLWLKIVYASAWWHCREGQGKASSVFSGRSRLWHMMMIMSTRKRTVDSFHLCVFASALGKFEGKKEGGREGIGGFRLSFESRWSCLTFFFFSGVWMRKEEYFVIILARWRAKQHL